MKIKLYHVDGYSPLEPLSCYLKSDPGCFPNSVEDLHVCGVSEPDIRWYAEVWYPRAKPGQRVLLDNDDGRAVVLAEAKD